MNETVTICALLVSLAVLGVAMYLFHRMLPETKSRDELFKAVVLHLIGIQKTWMKDTAAQFVDLLNATQLKLPAGQAFRRPPKLDDPSDEAQADAEEQMLEALSKARAGGPRLHVEQEPPEMSEDSRAGTGAAIAGY